MPTNLTSIEKEYGSPNIQTKNTEKPICSALPNNNESNPFINFFNSLLNTAETQISRQKTQINQYALLYQIITNQTLLKTSSTL